MMDPCYGKIMVAEHAYAVQFQVQHTHTQSRTRSERLKKDGCTAPIIQEENRQVVFLFFHTWD